LVLNDQQRILSRPLRLLWAGWETNTLRLQQAGWQLSAEQDFYQNRMRIAMRHQSMNLMAMTPSFDFSYESAAMDQRRYLESFPIQVCAAMGSNVSIHEAGRVDWMFKDIDAQPTFTTNKISKLEDLAHFAAPLVRCNEIIIPNESVDELMERILKLQQPARTDRIREEMRSPAGLAVIPKQHFHAQIISLAA
jgi:hypothetical protein